MIHPHPLPFDDVTVLELGECIAPAYAGMLLAELGATVVRVDDPRGTGLYATPPIVGSDPEGRPVGGAYLYLNRNKRSVAVDLETLDGRTALGALLNGADIVIDGLGVDQLQDLGFPHEDLLADPGRIVAAITPFGLAGPYRDLAASDLTILALGGLLNMVGAPEREPLSLGGSQAQYATGLSAFTALMAALLYRDRTARGQLIDVSFQESIAFIEWKSATYYEADGNVRRRIGDHSPSMVLETTDGYLGLMYTDANWPAVRELTGLDALDNPRFRTRPGRTQHADELRAILAPWFAARSKHEIYHAAQARKIPLGFVATFEDLLHSGQYAARGFWEESDHPATGAITYPGAPYRITGLVRPGARAPVLGEQTRDILATLPAFPADDRHQSQRLVAR